MELANFKYGLELPLRSWMEADTIFYDLKEIIGLPLISSVIFLADIHGKRLTINSISKYNSFHLEARYFIGYGAGLNYVFFRDIEDYMLCKLKFDWDDFMF